MRSDLIDTVSSFNHNITLFSFTSTDPGLHGGLCLVVHEILSD